LKKISLVVPCFNEALSLHPFYTKVCEVLAPLQEVELEFMFVDDGSSDDTLSILHTLCDQDARVKMISFSRNFGKEAALFAGIRAVTGDCCVILDADLQHPPEVILEMYELWSSKNYEVVEGLKCSRGEESKAHSLFAKAFYAVMSRAIGMDMNRSSDFKLLDRCVVDELAKLTERNTFFRALSFWMGFKRATVYFDVQERVAGTTKWSFFSLLKYALDNVISFSNKPLHIIAILGILFAAVGSFVGIDVLYSLFNHTISSGYPTLIFVILISSGAIMMSLGIVGIYISKMYDEIKHRPQYIIREKRE